MSVVEDWERFFTELSVFIEASERHLGQANENYAEFVVDRLELFIVTVSSLAGNFQVYKQINNIIHY